MSRPNVRPSLVPCLVLLSLGCGDPTSPELPPAAVFEIITASRTLAIPSLLQLETRGGSGDVIQWRSSDPNVAGVSGSGSVTTIFPGSTIITATRGDESATLALVVEATWIDIGPSQVVVALAGTVPLTATVRGVNGDALPGVPVVWSTANPGIATVNALTGIVTGVATGTTTITVTGGGATGSITAYVDTPSSVPLAFSTIGGTNNHLCGLEAVSGIAYCWGDGHAGALGIGNRPGGEVPTPVSGSRGFSMLTVGSYATCGIETLTGLTWCWGHNENGDLGTGNQSTQWEPARVQGGVQFASVSASGSVTCGIEAQTGLGYCWGQGGLVGDGTLEQRSIPTLIGSGLRFGAISAGGHSACGIEAQTGRAFCWGENSEGILGDGTRSDRLAPTPVDAGGRTFSSISVGRVTCAIEAGTGLGYCWGPNNYGQIGDGTTIDRLVPTLVGGGALRFSSISATGDAAACGIEALTGHAYCWGRNGGQPVGTGTLANRLLPTIVGGGSPRFTSIGATFYGACAVEAGTGLGYCWDNSDLVLWPVPAPTFLAPRSGSPPQEAALVAPYTSRNLNHSKLVLAVGSGPAVARCRHAVTISTPRTDATGLQTLTKTDSTPWHAGTLLCGITSTPSPP